MFSTRQVLLLKGNDRAIQIRIRSGRWVRDAQGVLRLLGAPLTPSARQMGVVVASEERAVLSHRAAAHRLGLQGFDRCADEFTVPRTSSYGRRLDGVVHQSNCLPSHHVTVLDGVPTTTLARTLLDLTAVVPIGRAERAMDTALGHQNIRYLDLVRMLEDVTARGRRRTRVFRKLLAERGPLYRPPATELERRFGSIAAVLGAEGWSRQVDVGDREAWIGRVDLYHRVARLIVELDGKATHTALLDRRADAQRDRRAVDAGFGVLRFGWAQVVGDANAVITTIRSALDATLRS